jgi:tyrosine-protein phosphatase YwqE
MSTATLTFDLNDIDDRIEFNRITKARDMASLLWEIQMNGYRKFTKYNERQEEAYQEGIEEVFEYFRALLSHHEIDIEQLIV